MTENKYIQKICEAVECDKESIISELVNFIEFNTVNPPGNEAPLAYYIAEEMRKIGLNVDFEEPFPGRPNVLASLKYSDGPCFMWNSHMDTVPIGKVPWKYDPFKGEIQDGFLFGRGACDAKGSLAAMMAAVKILVKLDIPLRGELFFTPVVYEEGGGKGTTHFVRNGMGGRNPIAAVVGEPTSCQIAIGHRGSNRRKVIFKGRSLHSSEPDKGINAIYRAARFALEIENLHKELKVKSIPYLGSAVVSANIISGGINHNIIPDHVEMTIDRRRLPGEGKHQLDQEIADIVERLRQSDPTFECEVIDLDMDKEPVMVDPSELIVEKSIETFHAIKGEKPNLTGVKAGTDMTFITNEGNVPCIIYGPGSMSNAHTVDEFVPIKEVLEAVKFYATLATKILK